MKNINLTVNFIDKKLPSASLAERWRRIILKYYLMNKDEKIVYFETAEQFGVSEIVDEKRLSEILPIGFVDMSTWVEQRNYAKHKEHMKKWLAEWGIDNIDGFLQITHALGLNDTFWVREYDSDLSWDKINLYNNEFSDVACKTAFETGLYGLQLSTTSPEFTSDGTFPKCWIKENGEIFILKQGLSGASNVGLEPNCEFSSSIIGQSIFKNVVDYGLTEYKGKLCSVCKLFTSESVGYIPFGKTVDINKHYTIPGLIHYFEDYDEKNKTDMCSKFKTMIVLDSIVFNQDRHLNNFGFLFDTASMEIIDFAPYFDFNFSFLSSLTNEDLENYRENFVKYDIGHKLGGDFDKVGREIVTPGIKALLPNSISVPIHPCYNFEKERIELLNDVLMENFSFIKNENYIKLQSINRSIKHRT